MFVFSAQSTKAFSYFLSLHLLLSSPHWVFPNFTFPICSSSLLQSLFPSISLFQSPTISWFSGLSTRFPLFHTILLSLSSFFMKYDFSSFFFSNSCSFSIPCFYLLSASVNISNIIYLSLSLSSFSYISLPEPFSNPISVFSFNLFDCYFFSHSVLSCFLNFIFWSYYILCIFFSLFLLILLTLFGCLYLLITLLISLAPKLSLYIDIHINFSLSLSLISVYQYCFILLLLSLYPLVSLSLAAILFDTTHLHF